MRVFSFCLIVIFAFLIQSCLQPSPKPEYQIWFNRPADYFEEAFPLGNGRIGATVFGGVHQERILLNEETLWAGEPVDPYMNKDAYLQLPEIRKALFSENYKLADELVRQLQGKFSESYLPLGDIYFDFTHQDSITNYKRELDLATGISLIRYTAGSTSFSRETFVSYPDQVIVIRLIAEGPSKLNFEVHTGSLLMHEVEIEGNKIRLKGIAPIHAEPSYRSEIPDPIVYDQKRGMRFESTTEIVKNDGTITRSDGVLTINNASETVLLVSLATSFNGRYNQPGLEGKDESLLVSNMLTDANLLSYNELKKKHITDFSRLFDRVHLELGPPPPQQNPTDERLIQYSAGNPDNNLEALYFQFGRYLLISSSRPGGQPATLQGIWNPHLRPPWSSNYTTNINAEMNYWPAELCNLTETHAPLLDFIGDLEKSGQVSAKTIYNCEGWCCSHNSDLWAMTNPVGDFGKGHPVWANWSMAGPWYSTHLWEHFLFTNDTSWLENHAWPLMKGAAEFCLDFLVKGPDGSLVTAPSTSPENLYITEKGYTGATLYGSTADLAMIKQHFLNTLKAAELLQKDSDFSEKLEAALEELHPYTIGSKGHLQEWYHDWEDQDPHHRHVSHLFGLYPGNTISLSQTPELANAARRSLELRGDGGTGWSKAWKINLWARLHDGNHAHTMLQTHLNYTHPNPESGYSGGGTYPNLWDAHPPFQIDGNFGGTAGIAEMLLQSHLGEIHLLPALPDAWPQGSVSGLKARGGYEVTIHWKDGELVEAVILPQQNGRIQIRYADLIQSVEGKAGESIIFVK